VNRKLNLRTDDCRLKTEGLKTEVLYLVHHADAVSAAVDPVRPLSRRGRAAAETVAADAARRGVRPSVIWHSGKVRARQTAEIFWQACNPLALVAAVRGLQPEDDPAEIRHLLSEEADDVMIVGHYPYLPALLHLLVTGRRDGHGPEFPQHGLVALERTGDGWEECWRLKT
jgi:phosphohistidine phosphatase